MVEQGTSLLPLDLHPSSLDTAVRNLRVQALCELVHALYQGKCNSKGSNVFFINKLMGGLNCSFTASVAHFQPPKANVDDDSCAMNGAHPSVVQVCVWCTFK